MRAAYIIERRQGCPNAAIPYAGHRRVHMHGNKSIPCMNVYGGLFRDPLSSGKGGESGGRGGGFS